MGIFSCLPSKSNEQKVIDLIEKVIKIVTPISAAMESIKDHPKKLKKKTNLERKISGLFVSMTDAELQSLSGILDNKLQERQASQQHQSQGQQDQIRRSTRLDVAVDYYQFVQGQLNSVIEKRQNARDASQGRHRTSETQGRLTPTPTPTSSSANQQSPAIT